MDHHPLHARRGEIPDQALKICVRLAVDALRALGQVLEPREATALVDASPERSASSELSLAAMCALADALAEQIDDATRLPRRLSHAHLMKGGYAGSVTAGGFAECLASHMTACFSASGRASLTPAQRIRPFIETHYAERLTLASIARAIGCARSQVAAMVKDQIGLTTHRYIARMRVRRAAELITQGNKIDAVMLSVGYRSKKDFYRQFKLETGFTPGVYRRGIRLRPANDPSEILVRMPPSAAHGHPRSDGLSMSSRAEVNPDPMTPTVTVRRASELLGVSRRTVYYWIKNGKLQTVSPLNGGQRILVASFPDVGI